jgi:mannitol 2-dehydrogenase
MVDRHAGRLTSLARRQREDPGAFVSNTDLFGDLAGHQRFMTAYRAALASLHQHGARATLESLA